MDSARLERLLDRYLDEALTPEEKTEIEGMLHTSPQARQIFWERARFHALLRESGAEGRGRELAQEPDRRWLDTLARLIGLLQRHAGWAVAAAAVGVAAGGGGGAGRRGGARGGRAAGAGAV